ncbi:uncharacterized protein LOC132714657 [Ruditapes philippinarum]|uniref:uncharacterized protein LOC132714657 n=1 Tax=Ruditapes philippinarum TaxID=129788 RepID=UPI00295C321B|nr:uncharacterized protein LOC132714657 [Ruditapes philippinarum]
MNEFSSDDIPEDLYKLCPYSNVCNRTASRILEKNTGRTPCCSSCSCSEDCGLQLNCCFDHLDRYNLIESGRVACLNPKGEAEENATVYSNDFGYYMVQQCETATPPFAEAAQCRLKDEFGNSLLSPVSSLETNMIYINKACAECNKLDTSKLQQWNYLYISSFARIERDLTFEIEQYAKNRLGKVIYEPPVDQDWSHKRCYYNFLEIKSCQNNRHLLEKNCLSIYCPEGMVKTNIGCRYFALNWYVPVIVVKLRLTPDAEAKLSVSKLHSIKNTERTNPFTWLRIPCRQIKITSLAIAYLISKSYTDRSTCLGSGECIISSLKVVIYKKLNNLKGINPSVAIPIFERCLRKQWKAVIRNSTIRFKADFYNGNDRYSEETDTSLENIPKRDTYTYFTEGPTPIKQLVQSNAITLTKPFFCKQVRVPQSDIEVIRDGILIISRNITLGSNEYIVNDLEGYYFSAKNKTTYSVCIDDYDPNFTKSSVSSIHETFLSLFMTIALYQIIYIYTFIPRLRDTHL